MLFPDKDTKYTSPKWLRYLLLGFMAFVIIRGFFLQDDEGNNAVQRFQQLEGVQGVTSESYMNKITNPELVLSSNPRFSTITSKPGTGDGAVCGDVIELKVRGSLEDGSAFDEAFDESAPLSVRLGAGAGIEVLEKAALGMKSGEARKVESPAEMVYAQGDARRDYKGKIIFNIERVDELPMVAAENRMPLMQELLERGEGASAQCGDQVTIELLRYNLKGQLEEYYPKAMDRPYSFQIGESWISGLNRAVVGMAVGAKKVVTVPPRFAGAAQELLVLHIRRVK